MPITKEMLKAIRPEINAALLAVAKKFELQSLACGKCIYDPSGGFFTMKVEGIAAGGVDANAKRYTDNMRWTGLPPLGFEFTQRDGTYRTCGMNTTGSKVICERTGDGKKFLFHLDDVKKRAASKAKEAA
jgi:hypothetical protein